MQSSSVPGKIVAINRVRYFIKAICRIPARIGGYEKCSLAIQRVGQKYDFDSHEYVGVATAGIHKTERKVNKENFMKSIEVLFEGKYYQAPENYDTYLSQLYGEDYMQMPPEEEQKSHHIYKMYWKKQD